MQNIGAPEKLENELLKAHDTLLNGTGAGADFTGWVNLPRDYDTAEFARVVDAANKIKSDSAVLVVIGIGGSYLGARAAIEFMNSPFYNQKKNNTPEIYFAGNNLSPDYINEIIELIGERDFSINVISKSGTTTEPAIAFRIFKDLIEKKYGKLGAKSRIYATTDAKRGALKTLADAEGYESFVIPDDVGGRYSVLTPVGLLPIAVSGVDINAVMAGALAARDELCENKSLDNPAWRYAAARNVLYRNGFSTEILACFEPRFRFMAEWWKQLFGESEGKDGKGIFPTGMDFNTDLHSL
ncbi:MAG: glucose-6-phosphate isomerase, partial [Clostridia bacterium]